MSATLNQVTLIGNLTRDPELGQTAGGATMCRLRLAVNETFRDRRTGEERTIATFLDVVAWGPVAENCGRFLGKGRQVLVCGRLYTEEWVDKETGRKRSMVKVRADRVGFLGGAKETNPERTERAVPKGQTFHGHREQKTESAPAGRATGGAAVNPAGRDLEDLPF